MNGAAARGGFAVFMLALLLRLGWVVVRTLSHGPALEFPDEELHWQLARNLVTHGSLVSPDGQFAVRMPLYPLYLALFAGAGPAGIGLARVGQALLGASAAWLAHRWGTRAAGTRAGLLAGGLVALDPYGVFFAHLLLTETLFTTLAVALSYAAWRVACRPNDAWAASLGVALAGAGVLLTRPSAAGWIVLLWAALWWFDRDRGRATLRTALLAGGLALALLPWGLRNRAVLGDCAWLSTNGGVTLYDAQGPQARGDSDQTFLKFMPELARLGEVERDRRLRSLAWEQMRRDPPRVARLAWTKLLRTWSLRPNFAEYRGGWASAVSVAFMLPVLVLAAAGIVRLSGLITPIRRRHPRLLALLLLPIAYFSAVHCVYVGSLRYRVPLMPFVELAAGAALLSLRREQMTVRAWGVDAEFRMQNSE
jgi:4-amino-4-deoxy-L-arabinose transferase-like glycosyltransferase